MDKTAPIKDLCIDVGLSQEEAKGRIPTGTPGTYRGAVRPWGRSCCAARPWTTAAASPFCWTCWSGWRVNS